MIRLIGCALLEVAACAVHCLAAPQNSMQTRVTISSNFADGMMDAWESYPFAEDDGYDPTLRPVEDSKVHGIERIVSPLMDGCFRAGFIRPLHLTVAPFSQIDLNYRLKTLHPADEIRIVLFRGAQSDERRVRAVGAGWQHITLQLGNHQSGEEWTALAIVAQTLHGARNESIDFAISDVRITGLGQARSQLVHPDALWDEARSEYDVRRSYEPGDTFTFAFSPVVTAQLLRPDGGAVQLDPKGQYKFRSEDPIGIWKLRAVSKNGIAIAKILVQSSSPSGLYFNALPHASSELLDQITERRNELRRTVHVEYGRNIAVFDENWLLPGLPSYFQLLVPPSELALDDAILFRYRKDQDAANEARKIVRSMSAWPTWIHPWFAAHGQHTYYPVGLATANLVAARIFLGSALSSDESIALDHALMQQSILPAYDEYVGGNRLPFSVSNWIGNTVGGALLASLSMADRNSAGYTLALMAKEEEHLRAAYMRDGDYGEGTSYLRFDLEMSSLVVSAVKRRLDADWLPLINGSDRYLRNATYGEHHLLDFGDTHTELTSTDVLAYLAAEGMDPQTSAFYRTWRSAKAEHFLLRLLWDEAALKRANSLALMPQSSIFPDRGVAVLRSASDSNARLVAIRAGANFNHNHADQGEVQIAAQGAEILTEAGYADYYKDPSYQSYVVQAAGHNVLLVDENPMSQIGVGNRTAGAHPSFSSTWTGQEIDVVAMDLQSAYTAPLASYKRWVIAPHAGPVIIIDRVRSGQPHTFTLLWHPAEFIPHATNSSLPKWTIGPSSQRWTLHSVATVPLQGTETRAPMPLSLYEQAENRLVDRPSVLRVATQSPIQSVDIVTQLMSSQSTGPSYEKGESMRAKSGNSELLAKGYGWKLRIANGNQTDDSVLSYQDDRLLLLLHAHHWSDGVHSVLADVPCNLELDQSPAPGLQISSELSGEMTLRGYSYVGAVRLQDNVEVKARAGGSLLLPVVAGKTSWRMISH